MVGEGPLPLSCGSDWDAAPVSHLPRMETPVDVYSSRLKALEEVKVP